MNSIGGSLWICKKFQINYLILLNSTQMELMDTCNSFTKPGNARDVPEDMQTDLMHRMLTGHDALIFLSNFPKTDYVCIADAETPPLEILQACQQGATLAAVVRWAKQLKWLGKLDRALF